MMTLRVVKLPSTVFGIYGNAENIMADRMLYLAPDAAKSFLDINADLAKMFAGRDGKINTKRRPDQLLLRVSDMFRSAKASLEARAQKSGVQPPSKSGHNFGFSIDIDLGWVLAAFGWNKQQLDEYMNSHGWYCHRKDHLKDEPEAWHFNYFGATSTA
jgi:hypothetical protein